MEKWGGGLIAGYIIPVIFWNGLLMKNSWKSGHALYMIYHYLFKILFKHFLKNNLTVYWKFNLNIYLLKIEFEHLLKK